MKNPHLNKIKFAIIPSQKYPNDLESEDQGP